MTGKITRLIKEKLCGFIKGENRTDYFFHASALKNTKYQDLALGQDVTFEDVDAERGPRAEDVYV